MREMISFPVTHDTLSEFRDTSELESAVRSLGCDGLELIWGGEDPLREVPCPDCVGYHLIFYQDWLDFWRGDEKKLLKKFGTKDMYTRFYGGENRDCLLRQYSEDLERAVAAKARYVVFHVSDVSIEEVYSYRWLHSDEEVIDAAIELINTLTDGRNYPFKILVENQWWPGLTLTKPAITERLLSGIHCADKGIMLDTGHLMNTCLRLKNEEEGVRYIQKMLDEHGELSNNIHGVHLHKSLSGEYVSGNTGKVPSGLSVDYFERFSESYAHVLKIDRHEPWSCPDAAKMIRRINPDYLVHELAASCRQDRETAIIKQKATLKQGKEKYSASERL